jgi:hypothetical protein
MQGWECPKCGAVMSPFHPTCWYCRPGKSLEIPGSTCSPTNICTCKTSSAICAVHGVLGLGGINENS